MTNVYLTITSQTLTVETLDTGMLLFQHNLFLVSFASAGDGETLDFICYVAKTDQDTRMCYVFECPGGLAQDVIITIGQAFQLGYQKSVTTSLSRKAGALMRDNYLPNNNNRELIQSVAFDNFMDFEDSAWLLENEMLTSNQADNMDYCKSSCDAATTSAQLKVTESTQQQLPKPLCTTDEVNNRKSDAKTAVGLSNFDHLEPVGEPWYVGKMSRSQAENLLRYDGDFLVRASIQQPGQFVLSGLQDGKYRHLLLADPNGKVRTKERVFDSIQHLIDYHVQNGAPIRSLDSEIKLIFPVSTHTFCIT
ncbi:unnamed protein product [Heterobilharzia americana]|nr:unnamed protein product [Heterobilharzia americana]CAH8467181.1 unnamed protein product [Heterobilharzia americana]